MPEPCVHGCRTVCPHCDPRGFLLAYVRTRAILEGITLKEGEAEEMVDQVMVDSSQP